MERTEADISGKTFRQMHALQRKTWLQTLVFAATALGFATHDTASYGLHSGEHTLVFPLWFNILFGMNFVFGLALPWFSFRKLQLYEFKYIRWANWHVTVIALFVFFVFTAGLAINSAGTYGALAGVVYGAISATIIARIISHLPQADVAVNQPVTDAAHAMAQNNVELVTVNLTVQLSRYERLRMAQQEEKQARDYLESVRREIWQQPMFYSRYMTLFFAGMPLLLPLLLPLYPLDRWLWLQIYVDWMASIVPAVAHFLRVNSPYGQLAATVNALMWPWVFMAMIYLWAYFIPPVLRTNKNLCVKLKQATNVYLGLRNQRVDIALKRSSNPSSLAKPWSYFMGLLFVMYVVLSDLNAIPHDLVPMFGPLAGNGFFANAITNRFVMGMVSSASVVMVFIVYAYVPILFAQQLIFNLKPDVASTGSNSQA